MTAGPTIYVVEDDAGMRDAVSLLLRSASFDVRSYSNAESFLSEVDCSKPICLLTDVRLPEMDGIALFRCLVRLGTEPAVVVITGHGDIPMAVAALKEGVVDFVEKPFDPGMLLDSVRDASRRATASHERKGFGGGCRNAASVADAARDRHPCAVDGRASKQGDCR